MLETVAFRHISKFLKYILFIFIYLCMYYYACKGYFKEKENGKFSQLQLFEGMYIPK